MTRRTYRRNIQVWFTFMKSWKTNFYSTKSVIVHIKSPIRQCWFPLQPAFYNSDLCAHHFEKRRHFVVNSENIFLKKLAWVKIVFFKNLASGLRKRRHFRVKSDYVRYVHNDLCLGRRWCTRATNQSTTPGRCATPMTRTPGKWKVTRGGILSFT